MTPGPSFLRRSAPFFLAFAAFAALTALLHPLIVLHPDRAILGGDSVSGYYIWQLWHLAGALRSGASLFHTPLVFHPAGADVFLSSPLLEAAGVLLQAVASPRAAFNVLLLATYPLTGAAAFVLLRRLTGNAPAAAAGAFLHAFSAYMLNQHRHGHVDQTAIFLNPLLVLAALAFWERPTTARWGWLLAAAAGVCLADPYVAFYFGGLLAAGTLLFDLFVGKRRWLKGLAERTSARRWLAAALVPAAAVAAYWPLLRHAGEWTGGAHRMSLYVLAHIHPPVWHRALPNTPFFQDSFMTEETIGYLGLAPLALLGLIAARRLWRAIPGLGYWLWITLFSAVMSWGPVLRLTPSWQTRIPLPYALVEALPILDSFRTVSRAWILGALAAAVWTALALAKLTAGWGRRGQWALALGICGLWAGETDLPQIRHWAFHVRDMAVHQLMREDPAPGALLELPNGPDMEGDLPPAGYLYMLHQSLHGRPLVLATLARHRPSDLRFVEETPGFRELTHPWELAALDKDPRRAAALREQARDAFARNGVRYVLWHRKLKAFVDVPGEALVERTLERWFGPPVARDGDDHLLYRTEAAAR